MAPETDSVKERKRKKKSRSKSKAEERLTLGDVNGIEDRQASKDRSSRKKNQSVDR